jgi:translation initiation factor 2B subunit (eIF-2B alpha/beta/delta family)
MAESGAVTRAVKSLEARAVELGVDRRHGAGYLARRALGLLAAAEGEERHRLAELIRTQRPAMPAIAAAVDEVLREGDVRAVLRRADRARQRVVDEALPRLGAQRRVATISNSSLVARLLVSARPASIVVAVEDQGDEGWLLFAELRAVGLEALVASVDDVDADVTVVGCDAIFDDYGFVNRRGTSRLLARMGARPAIVLGDPWKVVPGPSPQRWHEPDRFEVVAPADNVMILR